MRSTDLAVALEDGAELVVALTAAESEVDVTWMYGLQ